MRRSYSSLCRRAGPIPLVHKTVPYNPIRTYVARRAVASRHARQRARLRRARMAERWIVRTMAWLLAAVMLPMLVVAGFVILAIAMKRRYTVGREWRRTPTTAEDAHMSGGASLNPIGPASLTSPRRQVHTSWTPAVGRDPCYS
jgi:hypothetical protein